MIVRVYENPEIARLHNPKFTYHLEGRSPQVYPEVGERIIGKLLSQGEFEVCSINELHPKVLEVIENNIDGKYLSWLFSKAKECQEKNVEYLLDESGDFLKDSITPITSEVIRAILCSVSIGLYAIDDLISLNQPLIFYLLCRPPGHHAGREKGGGFCYLNNVGLSIDYLNSIIERKRIAVLDLDLHLGNGTIEYLKDVLNTKYYSIHLDVEKCYPYLSIEEQRELYQLNRNIELTQFEQGTTEDAYLHKLKEIINKINEEHFDYLFISMGYDTHEKDPCNGFCLMTESYKKIAELLAKEISIPIIAFHEGGYNVESAYSCRMAFLDGLKGGANV